MADTHFELSMDEYVRQNLPWRTWVQYKNPNGDWVTNQYDIKEGLDYRVGFRVTNEGSETFVKKVQIRVNNRYPARVKFFADDTYTDEVPRSSKGFSDRLAPNEFTPWHWVYFRLASGPDEFESIASVGIYAEIIPQGQYWRNFSAYLD